MLCKVSVPLPNELSLEFEGRVTDVMPDGDDSVSFSLTDLRSYTPTLDEQCAAARERVADCVEGHAWAASTQLQTEARLHAIRADRDLVQWNRERRVKLGAFARSIGMVGVNRITWGW